MPNKAQQRNRNSWMNFWLGYEKQMRSVPYVGDGTSDLFYGRGKIRLFLHSYLFYFDAPFQDDSKFRI